MKCTHSRTLSFCHTQSRLKAYKKALDAIIPQLARAITFTAAEKKRISARSNEEKPIHKMAKTLLVFLLVAVATLQLAYASYHYCNRPYGISYGGYTPYQSKYRVGYTINYYCNDGYYLYSGSKSTKCLYDSYSKRSYWSHKAPICKRRKLQCFSKLDLQNCAFIIIILLYM